MKNTLKRRQKSGEGFEESALPLMLFFPVFLFYSELVTRLTTYGELSFRSFLSILLLSLSGGLLLSGILSLIRNRTALRITAIALSFLLAIVFASQIVYYEIFGNYYSWENIGMAGEAISDFSGMFFEGLGKSLWKWLLLFLPPVLLAVFNRQATFYAVRKSSSAAPLALFAAASVCFVTFSLMLCSNKSFGSAFYYYNHPTDRETYLHFGVLNGSRLNIERILFGEKDGGLYDETVGSIDETLFQPIQTDPPASDSVVDSDSTDVTTEEPPKPVEYGYNVMDIDFESLIANAPNKTIKSMHEYFSSVTPTKQNEYTGYFEGKNLIFLTLEGFSGQVIDPELTPTLYKMANEGFVFNNYYCSCWGGSTSTGEYANLTGNFFNSVTCMTRYGGTNYQPFVLGNQFKNVGYTTYAFHGHTYSYYKRQNSHTNFGYTYLGVGNGLEKLTDSEGNTMTIRWPNSDLEVAKVSIGEYIDKAPFHVYYMTISGHAEYNFLYGNAMCMKHKAEVAELPYSDQVRAYIACQLEVEYMLTELVDQLDAAGILEDTVFVMAPDHYPYALSQSSLAELYGLEESNIYKNFDLYRNSLIIWSACMEEPVIVDTPCSAIDILPTVSNLFGLEYDSRLMMGTDIFSDQEPLVILNCDKNGTSWNWINKYGEYNSSTGFTVAEGYEADASALSSYVKSMTALVSQKWSYAKKIVTEDYYSYVFGKK